MDFGKYTNEQLEAALSHLELTGGDATRIEEIKHELEERKFRDTLEHTEAEWRGLMKRPAENDPGWVTELIRTPYGRREVRRWKDENGEVQWMDYPPQQTPDKDYYFIAGGAQDTTARIWNWRWSPAELIDQWHNPEGLARLRDYPGKSTRSSPYQWPEPYRSAFLSGHPDWKGTGEEVKYRWWLPQFGLKDRREYYAAFKYYVGRYPGRNIPDGQAEYEKKWTPPEERKEKRK